MSQNDEILEHLKRGGTLTGLEALQMFGCFRLASRISDLKREGHEIVKQMVERNGKFVAKYSYIPKDAQ